MQERELKDKVVKLLKQYLSNLRHSGFYTDDNGKHMKCVEEIVNETK